MTTPFSSKAVYVDAKCWVYKRDKSTGRLQVSYTTECSVYAPGYRHPVPTDGYYPRAAYSQRTLVPTDILVTEAGVLFKAGGKLYRFRWPQARYRYPPGYDKDLVTVAKTCVGLRWW